MSHKWWHPFKSDEEKRLEELRAQETGITRLGEGAIELKKDELKQIRNEINQLKVDNPDSEFIQDNFSPTGETGIFGIPQENPMLENIKRNLVNVGLKEVGAPDIINYDAATEVKDAFQQEGAGAAADTAVNLIKNGFLQEGLKVATGAGIPINTIMALANNPITGPFVQPALTDASDMFSDVTGGYGPRFYDVITSPFNFFGGASGIFNNQQNVVPVEEPIQQPVVQQPSVIDDYIASLSQPTTTQNNDGTQTISGGTSDPADDIVVTNIPKPIFRPTMADIAGPSNNNFTPSRPNTPPPGYSPRRRTGPNLTNRATGGLVSVSRYLKGR